LAAVATVSFFSGLIGELKNELALALPGWGPGALKNIAADGGGGFFAELGSTTVLDC